jgi:hypothetical protein
MSSKKKTKILKANGLPVEFIRMLDKWCPSCNQGGNEGARLGIVKFIDNTQCVECENCDYGTVEFISNGARK